MATIINSVAFENFYNYYGSYSDNEYKFKEGINIISADNNMGKSKFYNGFMWLLEDLVYDSDDKKFYSATESLEKMASGKAKREETQFKVGFKIKFTCEDKLYTVEKFAMFERIDNELRHKDPQLEIMITQNSRDRFVKDIAEKEKIINRELIPSTLRKYALLQGESMDELVDMSDKESLSRAIDVLAGISVIKESCERTEELLKKANSEYRKKQSKHTQADTQKDEDIKTRDEKEKKIEALEQDLVNYEAELRNAKNRREELSAWIRNTKRRQEIVSELAVVRSNKKREGKEMEDLEKSITSRLFDEKVSWLLMGLKEELDVFNTKWERYKEVLAKQNYNGTLIMLPSGSPDSNSLDRMLRKGKCEICGREAPEGSEPWLHIKKIFDRPKEERTTLHNFEDFYDNLQKIAGLHTINTPKIDDEIEDVKNDLDRKKTAIKEYGDDERELITQLKNAGGDTTNEDDDMRIIDEYDAAGRKIEENDDKIKAAKKELADFKYDVAKLNEMIECQEQDESVKDYQNFKKEMELIRDVFKETKDDIYKRTINILEKEANKKYSALTKNNPTYGGILKFELNYDDTVEVIAIDENKEKITGLGTGFGRMKQLAIIMAIISAKIGDEKKFDYPFISDAPFSEFGENFISNFFSVAPGVFTQSIIMIKDLYDTNDKDFLTTLGNKILERMKNGEIPGTFYVNIVEVNEDDPMNIVTSKKCYKY